MDKIVKIVLTINNTNISIENVTDITTKDELIVSCRNNLTNVKIFQVLTELNLKNIDDLMMKQYTN